MPTDPAVLADQCLKDADFLAQNPNLAVFAVRLRDAAAALSALMEERDEANRERFDALRVRGWGRLQYRKDCDPAALQDMIGALIAEAMTRLWQAEGGRDGD